MSILSSTRVFISHVFPTLDKFAWDLHAVSGQVQVPRCLRRPKGFFFLFFPPHTTMQDIPFLLSPTIALSLVLSSIDEPVKTLVKCHVFAATCNSKGFMSAMERQVGRNLLLSTDRYWDYRVSYEPTGPLPTLTNYQHL